RELEESRDHLLGDLGKVVLLLGVVPVPHVGVPDLGSVTDSDDGEVAAETRVVAKSCGNGHAQLLVGHLGVSAGEEQSHVVASALARERGLTDLIVNRLELTLAEDEDAALLAASDDDARLEFVTELG